MNYIFPNMSATREFEDKILQLRMTLRAFEHYQKNLPEVMRDKYGTVACLDKPLKYIDRVLDRIHVDPNKSNL